MAQEITVDIDEAAWSHWLGRFAERSKKTHEEILRDEARLYIKEVIGLTPPGKGESTASVGKKKGEATIRSDLSKLFAPVPKKLAEADVDLARLHKSKRNRRGRVPVGVEKRKVWKTDFNRYLRETLKRVGELAGGWNSAAAKLGHKPAPWIWRHQSPGSVKVEVSNRRIRIKMINKVDHASQMSNLPHRLQRAANRRAHKLKRRVLGQLEKDFGRIR